MGYDSSGGSEERSGRGRERSPGEALNMDRQREGGLDTANECLKCILFTKIVPSCRSIYYYSAVAFTTAV